MTVRFRNVDVDRDAAPDEWPFEAVLTALERGALFDWRVLAAAIRDRPWGSCAQAVETVVSWQELGPVDVLFGELLTRARADADAEARQRFGRWIRAARRSRGMSLRDLAPYVGTSAPRLSSYERGHVAPTVVVLARIERATGYRLGSIDEEDAHPQQGG